MAEFQHLSETLGMIFFEDYSQNVFLLEATTVLPYPSIGKAEKEGETVNRMTG